MLSMSLEFCHYVHVGQKKMSEHVRELQGMVNGGKSYFSYCDYAKLGQKGVDRTTS
jgi:hypothetical protein